MMMGLWDSNRGPPTWVRSDHRAVLFTFVRLSSSFGFCTPCSWIGQWRRVRTLERTQKKPFECLGQSEIWRNFPNLAKKWQILTVYFLFGKMLSLLLQICDIIGLVFIAANGQILKNNLTIWSHCHLPTWLTDVFAPDKRFPVHESSSSPPRQRLNVKTNYYYCCYCYYYCRPTLMDQCHG